MSVHPLPAVPDARADGDLLTTLPRTEATVWLHGDEGLVGRGTAARLDPGVGAQRFARAAQDLSAWFDAAPDALAFASFTFDPRSPGSTIVVPEQVLRRRGAGGTPSGRVRLLHRTSSQTAAWSVSEERWLKAVNAAIGELRTSGALRKVVLARDEWVPTPAAVDPRMLVRRLAARFPGCRTFLVDGLVGATPELLIRRRGTAVSSLVLAGSAPRAADPGADARLGAALQTSDKDRVEHRLAVTSVVDALTPRCRQLVADPEPGLLRLDNVQHLATAVHATLADPATALELAGALHPTAAVCGTPTDLALERIRTLEGMDRGRYSGPVGWVDAHGDVEFGIALRCAELTARGARLFAGAGIVADSVPSTELEEVRLKLRAISDALRG